MSMDEDDRPTAVVHVGPPPPDYSAEYEKVVKRVDRRLAWRDFGTLGYEAYRDWVLRGES